MNVDASSTIDNVTFEKTNAKFVDAGIGVENPQSLKGTIAGLSIGDTIQFGGLEDGHNVDITSLKLRTTP